MLNNKKITSNLEVAGSVDRVAGSVDRTVYNAFSKTFWFTTFFLPCFF